MTQSPATRPRHSPARTGALFVVLFFAAGAVSLGTLLGSFADPDRVFTERFADGGLRVRDIAGSYLLALAGLTFAWFAHGLSLRAGARRTPLALSGYAAAGGIVLAAVAFATVPLSLSFGSLVDDSGLEVGQAVLPQFGYVALTMGAMLPAAICVIIVARTPALVPRWLSVASYPVAVLLPATPILFMPLFLFVAWVAAGGGNLPADRSVMGEARYREAERALWSATGVEPEEVWITLARSGSKVRVLAVGEGPPVVFVHGATNGASSWANLAARLPGHRCWMVDRPGCGLSEPTGTRLRDADALADFADGLVVDILEGLDLPRASLVGTSFGGYFVLRAAAAHPDRVDRLVTLSWSLGAPIERVAPAMRIAGVRSLGYLMARIPPSKVAVKALLRQIGLRNAIDSGHFDDTALHWFRSLLRDTPTMRNELDAAPPLVRPITGLDEDLLLRDDTLQQISAPTLLIWGGDDPQGGAATARAFAARIPSSTLDIMEGAGHAPWMDDPVYVADALNRFLHPA